MIKLRGDSHMSIQESFILGEISEGKLVKYIKKQVIKEKLNCNEINTFNELIIEVSEQFEKCELNELKRYRNIFDLRKKSLESFDFF